MAEQLRKDRLISHLKMSDSSSDSDDTINNDDLEENQRISAVSEVSSTNSTFLSTTIKTLDTFFKGRKFRAARVNNFVRGLPVDELDKNDIADIANIYLGHVC